jgi:hypothetical protein
MLRCMQKLPIGIQSFEKLREGEFLYVDKTKEIHQLITSGHVFFLSRPRRFGKSLLVSAMEAVFKGEKELFEGLYLYDKWDWSQQYPVVRLDFGGLSYASGEELKWSPDNFLDVSAKKYQLTLPNAPLSDKFMELIALLHQSTGQKVVVW